LTATDKKVQVCLEMETQDVMTWRENNSRSSGDGNIIEVGLETETQLKVV
jgi:hypothetical protein